MTTEKFLARLCGRCSEFAAAIWSSISRTSVRPGAKIRAMPMSALLATAFANWSSRCWSRNSIRPLRRTLPNWRRLRAGEEDYWENEVSGWLGTTVQWTPPEWARPVSPEMGLVQISLAGPRAVSSHDADLRMKIDSAPSLVMNASVSRMWFLGEPIAVQRRLVKAIGENAGIPLEFKHVEEILRVASADGPSGKELSLPLGWTFVLESDELRFVTPDLREPSPPQHYEYELPVPGRIVVYEAGSSIEARAIPAGADAGYNPDHLLDAESLPGPFRVRNWRPGDRFWPAHTKSPKKIKELLQERHVAQPERRSWPVAVRGDEIVWVRGFPSPAKHRAQPGRAAIVIVDEPLTHEPATEE